MSRAEVDGVKETLILSVVCTSNNVYQLTSCYFLSLTKNTKTNKGKMTKIIKENSGIVGVEVGIGEVVGIVIVCVVLQSLCSRIVMDH
jgi:hypothetical protein